MCPCGPDLAAVPSGLTSSTSLDPDAHGHLWPGGKSHGLTQRLRWHYTGSQSMSSCPLWHWVQPDSSDLPQGRQARWLPSSHWPWGGALCAHQLDAAAHALLKACGGVGQPSGLYPLSLALGSQLEPIIGISSTPSQVILPRSPRKPLRSSVNMAAPGLGPCGLPGPVQALQRHHWSQFSRPPYPCFADEGVKTLEWSREPAEGTTMLSEGSGRHWGGTFTKKPRMRAQRGKGPWLGALGQGGELSQQLGDGAAVRGHVGGEGLALRWDASLLQPEGRGNGQPAGRPPQGWGGTSSKE